MLLVNDIFRFVFRALKFRRFGIIILKLQICEILFQKLKKLINWNDLNISLNICQFFAVCYVKNEFETIAWALA